jgi:quinol monooxygenase YgiN
MTTISQGTNVVTLVNVFTVNPENQQGLVDLLIETTETVMKKQPGYISANIHKSLDGVRVVNYAQWRSREDFEAIFTKPDVTAHMLGIMSFAKSDYHLYEVVYTDQVS